MCEEPALNSEEKELMQSLAGLLPTPPGVSDQTLWYEAGLRCGRRRSRISIGVAAAAIVLASGLAVIRPKPAVIYVERSAPRNIIPRNSLAIATPTSEAEGRIDYVRLRDAVEERGMDAISEQSGTGALSQPTLRAWSPQNGGSVPSPWDSINTRG